jgi:hypothetical protein
MGGRGVGGGEGNEAQPSCQLHRKFEHNHRCCPNSANIFTVSKMEAILDFGRGCQDLSIILWGGGGVGGCVGGALPQPSNPDNMAAGGATDAQCWGGWRWERWRGVACSI